MKFKKSHPVVRPIVAATFPEYKGRKPVCIDSYTKRFIQDYWDEGSRTYAKAYHLPTKRVIPLKQAGFVRQYENNPYNLDIGSVEITKDIAIVEMTIFQGKNAGISICIHPETYKSLGLEEAA